MRVSAIKVTLTEQDIMESIREYVKIDKFDVESIRFDEKIYIKCTYKIGIKIALKVRINIKSAQNNILLFSIEDVNIAKIHILDGIKNFALNKALKAFENKGIEISKDAISVNLNTIIASIPTIKFDLTCLEIGKGEIVTEVRNLAFLKETEETKQLVEVEVEDEIIDTKISTFIKSEDKYTSFRSKILKKIPGKYSELSGYAFIVPDILVLFGRLLKDKRVPVKTKFVIGSIITYFISPIDIAILFIPFVGEISAIALAFYGLSYVMNQVPEEIIIENWQGNEDFAVKIKNIVEFINKAAGGKNIDRLIKFTKGKGAEKK